MRKKTGRKLVLNRETLKALEPASAREVVAGLEIRIDLQFDTVTCASHKRCTGCVPCLTTG